ncbi:MAG: protein translocase subunit SecD [Lentisphaerae bacterium]|nr:protein translocase subunit SecD [Lentisphaerota bacterium]
MEKKPLALRTFLVLVVIATFAWAMYPLAPRDYYDTFKNLLKDPKNAQAAAVVERAQEIQKANPEKFDSEALLEAANEQKVKLTELIAKGDLENDKEVIAFIRKEASSSIRLGLDLNGGVEFYLKLVPDANVDEETGKLMEQDPKHYRDVVIENLRRRLEDRGIFETEIADASTDDEQMIVLRAPIVSPNEKAELRNALQMSAKLEFRLVLPATEEQLDAYKKDPASVPEGSEYMEYTELEKGEKVTRRFLISKTVEMDGKNITQARAHRDEMGQRKILLRFNEQGAKDFGVVTEKYKGEFLAIVLDGNLYCAPRINDAITGGSAEISGSFTEDEAQAIASALESGSIKYKIETTAMFDTDPTLGKSSVRNGIIVGIISLILVSVFMLIYYHFTGFIAVAALLLNMVLILGSMAAFGCTLTLPGIAGIVLTIGMAVDANVLVNERIREELRNGKSVKNAVNAGYDRALSAVLDSNITTLVVALILMNVGTGAIKGFAITLCIGILATLFSAIFVTRLIYDYLFSFWHINKLSMMQLFKMPEFDFIKGWKKALCFSGALFVLLIAMFFIRQHNLFGYSRIAGMDFTGGSLATFKYAKKGNTSKMAQTLRDAKYDQPSVSYKSGVGGVEVMEVRMANDQVDEKALGKLLADKYPELGINCEDVQDGREISGLIGKEFTKTAVIAVVLALIGIGVYILLRYEFSYALASVLALLHDVAVVLAIYLVSGRTVGLTTVAAFLTVIGYSINDTVVIFDRLRENLNLQKGMSFKELANLSINQSLSRTLITSFTTFIVVLVMWLFGGPEISDFVFVMMLGVILGTYSSIMLSAPFVAWRHERKLAKKNGGK